MLDITSGTSVPEASCLPETADISDTEQAVPEQAVQIGSITVRTGRLVCDVAIKDERFRASSPKLIATLLTRFPDLPHHACVNGVGDTFESVMETTSLPHLLEHLTISLLVRGDNAGEAAFIGTTEWMDERAGTARIQIGFRDDLAALRAFNEAVKIINDAVLTCSA